MPIPPPGDGGMGGAGLEERGGPNVYIFNKTFWILAFGTKAFLTYSLNLFTSDLLPLYSYFSICFCRIQKYKTIQIL